MLALTARAADALRTADAAARRFNPDARLRLRAADGGVSADLVTAPEDGESLVVIEGIELIVPDGISGTVDAGDHNAFTFV